MHVHGRLRPDAARVQNAYTRIQSGGGGTPMNVDDDAATSSRATSNMLSDFDLNRLKNKNAKKCSNVRQRNGANAKAITDHIWS